MVTNEFREPRDYDVRKLRGADADVYRTRIGDHRVFFLLEGDLVAILHVDDRAGAYGSLGTIDDRADEYSWIHVSSSDFRGRPNSNVVAGSHRARATHLRTASA